MTPRPESSGSRPKGTAGEKIPEQPTAAQKKSAAKKTAVPKQAAARKATAPAKKAAVKKTAVTQSPATKATAKKTAPAKTTAKKAVAKKAAPEKATAAKATAEKVAATKATAEKTAAKKTAAKKTAAKKTTAKKATAKKAAATKATATKAVAKKTTTKKAVAKKATTAKAAATKATATKATAANPPAKKAPAKKATAKKATAGTATAGKATAASAQTVPPEMELAVSPALGAADRDRLLNGTHHDPHSVLGAHPVPGGIAFRAFRPYALSVTVVAGEVRAELQDDGEGFFSGLLPLREVPEYRLLRGVRGDGPRHRGRLPFPAHAGRPRPAPDRRGPARGAVDGAGRAPDDPPGRDRHPVLGVGAERAGPARGRHLQLLGRHRARHAVAGLVGRVGAVPAGHRRGRAVQVRDHPPRRFEDDARRPDGPPHGGAARDLVGHHVLGVRVGRRRVAGPARRGTGARGAVLGVRGAPAVLAAGTDIPPTRRAAPGVRQEPGLHARGADAGRRASVRRLLGLSGHRLLRADGPAGHARRLPVPGRRAPPGRHRRADGLGARALPARRLGAGRVRRPAPVRARGSAAGRAPRLGHAGVRLRTQRGAQLPRRERPVLVRGVPHRRAARGRGGVDAVPRLLA
ncbi:hypothetical protein SVIOM74S_07787 [Streptomyces violarus]